MLPGGRRAEMPVCKLGVETQGGLRAQVPCWGLPAQAPSGRRGQMNGLKTENRRFGTSGVSSKFSVVTLGVLHLKNDLIGQIGEGCFLAPRGTKFPRVCVSVQQPSECRGVTADDQGLPV